ncbi:MAG: Na+/H+ antiporter NhaC family protein [Oscillibacter sp.]|nr:Na+/H+ antiporter NhaC family protein [Oscillibacter sp.]
MALAVTASASGGEAAVSGMYATFWALVPPIVAIVLALITKEAYSSLFIGILVGALFQCDFAPVATLDTIINDGLVSAIEGNAGIFLFLVLLGVIVALVNASGGSAAFGRWAEKNIRTRAGAMLATFALGVLIFIDDYFNCLTVGSVMRPVTDGHKISRQKLAYLIDATAAPVCMIAPVSSWAAAVSGVADDLNTGVSGIQLFIQAIPYNFYSLLTFVFIIALTVMKFDYGPMKLQEMNAQRKGDLGALPGSGAGEGSGRGRVMDLVIPVVILFVLCTVGMIYVGGFFGVDAWGGTENAGDFIGAFGNTDAFIGLPWGGIVALALIVIYVVARRVLTFREAMACVPKGFIAMVPPITILTLAVSLKNMTNLLGADVFVGAAMEGASRGLYSLLPAVIFVVACLLAFASGTSWGTFGILIPIVLPVFEPGSALLTIGISACLAGAVCGDHCSPISDTTIMASAGAQCDHVNHVATQLPYAITVAAVSFVCFLFAGFIQNAAVCLALGTLLIIGALFVLRMMTNKETAR